MKPIFVTLVVLAVLGLGAVTFFVLWITPVNMERKAPLTYGISAGSARPVDEQGEGRGDRLMALEAEVAMLGQQVVGLQDELDRLRLEGSRREVTPEQIASAAERSLDQSTAAANFTPAEREAVVEILAAVREEEEAQRAAERLEREEERVNQRAADIAKELGLSLADQDTLSEHMLASAEKRNEMMALAREDGIDPRSMREDWEALRDWNSEQLDTLFGPDLGDQIQRAERDLRGGFGRGDRGGDRGDRGGGQRGQGRTGGGNGQG